MSCPTTDGTPSSWSPRGQELPRLRDGQLLVLRPGHAIMATQAFPVTEHARRPAPRRPHDLPRPGPRQRRDRLGDQRRGRLVDRGQREHAGGCGQLSVSRARRGDRSRRGALSPARARHARSEDRGGRRGGERLRGRAGAARPERHGAGARRAPPGEFLVYVCRPDAGELVVIILWEEGQDAAAPRPFHRRAAPRRSSARQPTGHPGPPRRLYRHEANRRGRIVVAVFGGRATSAPGTPDAGSRSRRARELSAGLGSVWLLICERGCSSSRSRGELTRVNALSAQVLWRTSVATRRRRDRGGAIWVPTLPRADSPIWSRVPDASTLAVRLALSRAIAPGDRRSSRSAWQATRRPSGVDRAGPARRDRSRYWSRARSWSTPET